MKKIFAAAAMCALGLPLYSGPSHIEKYAQGIPGDKALAAAKKLNITIPVSCREWHIWWGSPYGSEAHLGEWRHWKGERPFKQFFYDKTIEHINPPYGWRRSLNCTGYPLLGPYDSGQHSIIRWQLQTAKNTGLSDLHVQVFPSIWDEGRNMAPIPIFETILEEAARLNYPVIAHDEVQFRRPKISGAQTLKSCIIRTTLFLKRYGKHPGLKKINGMPAYYFINWSHWISAKDMETYFSEVEKTVGPVYWILEMGPEEKYYKIPQIKAIVGPSNTWFRFEPTWGVKPYPWKNLLAQIDSAVKLARKYKKKVGIHVRGRFNDTKDRGEKSRPRIISADDGMFFIESLEKSMKCKPDFLILSQWNDFEEGGFIEPAWDFDGFNGDPYRYCRMIAAALSKTFVPAPLPERGAVDPRMRHKLLGGTEKGDGGPIFYNVKKSPGKVSLKWATEQNNPVKLQVVTDELAHWSPADLTFKSRKLRLANYSVLNRNNELERGQELRFYLPGVTMDAPLTTWLGIVTNVGDMPKRIKIEYRAEHENYRIDSRWARTRAIPQSGFKQKLANNRVLHWMPMYNSKFVGREGDITIIADKKAKPLKIEEVFVWHPAMTGTELPVKEIYQSSDLDKKFFVLVAYDKIENPGTPYLFINK